MVDVATRIRGDIVDDNNRKILHFLVLLSEWNFKSALLTSESINQFPPQVYCYIKSISNKFDDLGGLHREGTAFIEIPVVIENIKNMLQPWIMEQFKEKEGNKRRPETFCGMFK